MAILQPEWVVVAVTCGVVSKVRDASRNTTVPTGGPESLLFVPESVWTSVLQWGHSSNLACHPGASRTHRLIKQRFWWPSMARDARRFVAACPICERCSEIFWTLFRDASVHGGSPEKPSLGLVRGTRRRRTVTVPSPHITCDQKVWMSSKDINFRLPARKLGPKFIRPFVVAKVLSPVTVRLKLTPQFIYDSPGFPCFQDQARLLLSSSAPDHCPSASQTHRRVTSLFCTAAHWCDA